MPLPRDTTGLGDDAVEYPPKGDRHQDRYSRRTPTSQDAAGGDQERRQSEDNGACSNVHGVAASDRPSAQTAGDPDEAERSLRMILFVAQKKRQQDKQRQRIRGDVRKVGVEQGTPQDPPEPRQRSRHDAEPRQGQSQEGIRQRDGEYADHDDKADA